MELFAKLSAQISQQEFLDNEHSECSCDVI